MNQELLTKVSQHLDIIYQGVDIAMDYRTLAATLIESLAIGDQAQPPSPHSNLWSEKDCALITYGDSIQAPEQASLTILDQFVDTYLGNAITWVHILPFFPFSSDDGFSVIDYSSVNESLGDWRHIETLANKRKVMADLVINHCSARSIWFDNFIKQQGKGHNYFVTADPNLDTSLVVRPRTSDLLRAVETNNGTKWVWCTFSHDQIDLDFRNPDVLCSFVEIIALYLQRGIRIFRLDAVAFLWKEPGTPCINLRQTHEVVRLLRTLIEYTCPDAVIITETNIPNSQNLTYFGNANEAHCIYNFSLPPLLLNTLITGQCLHLKRWLMSMPPAQDGTCYFNFIASHDGIGLRPAEGLLSETELNQLIQTVQNFGGRISWRADAQGQQKAYELNISLIDALQGTVSGPDKWGIDRFICAHAIMFSLEGVPAVYIHSFLATRNDVDKVNHTHQNRSINRHRWDWQQLQGKLASEFSENRKVLNRLLALIDIRQQQAAFHPNATQFVLHLGPQLFGVWRQSKNRKQSIFSVSNVSSEPQKLRLSDLNLIADQDWYDLIGQQAYTDLNLEYEIMPYQTIWLTNYR